MRREIRLYVESELRDYDNTKKEWELIQEEICHSSPTPDGQPRGYGSSNPTESKASRLLTNKRLAQIERTVKAFERVMSSLPEERYRLIQMRYWDVPRTLTDDGIALELNVSKRTYYDWVNGIIYAIAVELGMAD